MRIRELDVLRAVAVLLVMVRHLKEGKDNPGLQAFVGDFLHAPVDLAHLPQLAMRVVFRCGWIGVDLFFVLSGFLVGGLLFAEYRARGEIRLGRFLVRRAFKIYPAFYVFLFASVAGIVLFTTRPLSAMAVVSEALFLQNYGPNVWGHTWSLAIEEHFYLLLGALLLLLSRRRSLSRIPGIFLLVASSVLVLRLVTTLLVSDFDFKTHVFATHLRIDALFYGVAIAYAWHLRPQRLGMLERPSLRPWLLVATLVLVAPAALLQQGDPGMRTLGLSGLSIAFSALLIWSLEAPALNARITRGPARVLAAMGLYSYSIYLWHVPVLVVGVPFVAKIVARVAHSSLGWPGELLVYFLGSVVVGIGMAKLVELPALRLRDRLFPSFATPRQG